MELSDNEKAEAQFDSVRETFNLLMGAKSGKIDTPVVIEIGFNSPEAEARGSARHVAESVEDEGYTVDLNYIEETTSHDGSERHRFSLRVTE